MKFFRPFSFFLVLLALPVLVRAQDQSNAYYQAGNGLYAQKNYDQAIRYYQAAVQVNPNFWQADQGMGNCYYAKGDKANALASYQKALAINPNNPQLSTFVQSLQAEVGAAPVSPMDGTSPAMGAGGPAASSSAKNLELDFGAGAGLASSASAGGASADFGFGFGGKARGLYLLPGGLGLGLSADYYTFSKTPQGSTTSFSYNFLDLTAAVKYKFDAGGFKPYVTGGVGMSFLSAGGGSNSQSESDPVIQFGGGAMIPGGPDMAFFAEVKYEMVMVGGKNGGPGLTYSFIPLEFGVSFDM
ncbi:MAG TPA: tetratricopeptide repeat protein [bacterium]|nr:tetratricopeptide repeat protein [bacterium]